MTVAVVPRVATSYSSNFYLLLTAFSASSYFRNKIFLYKATEIKPRVNTKCRRGWCHKAIFVLKIFLILELSDMITGEF